MSKEEILEGQLNEEELEEVAGGIHCDVLVASTIDNNRTNCSETQFRQIHKPSFPNCAATVEDGSHCRTNDACYGENAVRYIDLKDCSKAWE